MASVVQVQGQPNPMLTVDQIGQGIQNIRRTAAADDATRQQMAQSAQLQPYRVQTAQEQAQYLPLLDQAKIQQAQGQANVAARSGGMTGLAAQYNDLNYLTRTYGANDPRTLQLKKALEAQQLEQTGRAMYYMNVARSLSPQEKVQMNQEFHNENYDTGTAALLQQRGWTPAALKAYNYNAQNLPPLNKTMSQVIAGGGIVPSVPTGAPEPQPPLPISAQAPGGPSQARAISGTSPSPQAMQPGMGGAPALTQTAAAQPSITGEPMQQANEALQIASTVDKSLYTPQQLQQINRYTTVTTNLREMTPLVADAAKFAGAGGKLTEITDKQLGNLGIYKGSPQYNNLIKFKNLQTTLANELAAATLSPKTDTSLKEWLDFVKSPGATSPQEFVEQYNNLQGIIAEQAKAAATPVHQQIGKLRTFEPTPATLDSKQTGALGAQANMVSIKAPDGNTYTIPKDQLKAAQAAGGKLLNG
jgi:hypothetical protein